MSRMKTIILLIIVFLTGCGDMCGTEQLISEISPNGKLKAVSYLYDCGATTGFSTQVSVIPIDGEIDSAGNVLITDGRNKLQLKWLSDTELLVSSIKDLKIYKQVIELEGINVSYQ